MRKFELLLVKGLLIVLVGLCFGCAGKRTTTVSSTEIHRNTETSEASAYEREPVVEVTKTEEVTQDDGHKGFFGILGDIIALPFRAVGSIL